jgi:DNA replication protein DnaC
MQKLTAEQRRDLMEVIDDRHGRASTIIATQLPVECWHDMIGEQNVSYCLLL